MTLYTKLETLTKPSREVDAEIALRFGWQKIDLPFSNINGATEVTEMWLPSDIDDETRGFLEDEIKEDCAVKGWSLLGSCPAYTSDLNAVIDLVEREIPRACTFLDNEDETWGGEPIWNATTHTHKASHTIPAVALLMALMDAKGFKQ